jgi:hypothetical protein
VALGVRRGGFGIFRICLVGHALTARSVAAC